MLFLILLFCVSTLSYAQSNKDKEIPLQNPGNELTIDEKPKRDLELQSLLPVAMYNTFNKCIFIESQHIAFESVTYYITDEYGAVFKSCEISLPRNVVQSIPLPHLPSKTYSLVLEIDGMYFKGYFEY